MRNYHPDNERMKRKYLEWMHDARGRDTKTTDKVAASLTRFEESTRYKPFKKFHTEQAVAFKRNLLKAKNRRTGKPMSKATVSGILRDMKGFFLWLADQPGYKSRVRHSDADYFSLTLKDERIAHTVDEKPFPSMEQALHAFRHMPNRTELERRNKALFAFHLLIGARIGVDASLKLKHVDLIEGRIYQDPREVQTKASKAIYSWFFPVGRDVLECFVDWVTYLREQKLFGPDDPLFPKPQLEHGPYRKYRVTGVSREAYSSNQRFSGIIKQAFTDCGMPAYCPHGFRKTLMHLGNKLCGHDMEKLKAWSMNLGHEHLATSITSYLPLSLQRQGEIIKGLA